MTRNSHSAAERKALSRDVERGLLVRLGPGAYVERIAFESMTPEERHVVRMRALMATSSTPVVFSHFSAAVLHGLPVLRSRLGALHVVTEDDDDRHRTGRVSHHFSIEGEEIVQFGPLLATEVGRTVVDVAGAAPFEEGVMATDGALAAGVLRELLEEAIVVAGARRASRRIGDAIAFAHPGGESAAESRMRVTTMRLGIEVPTLQYRIRLRDGSEVFLDGHLEQADVGIEVDGVAKYLDPSMATEGTGRALVAEKWREDEMRSGLAGLVRIGWFQSGNTAALRAAYGRVGVIAARPRTTLDDYCAAARAATPRRPPREPRWRARTSATGALRG